MDYNNFDEKTRSFMNKAMDIYSTISDMEIVQLVRNFDKLKEYQFKKLDKKILSLFIAGFMVNGNLKDILEEYDDFKLKDLLDFIKINENGINKLADNEYTDFYFKNFRLDIESIIKEKTLFKNVNIITPEVIVWCLGQVTINGSNILNYFSYEHGLGLWFYDHALFKALENYNLMDGSISEKGKSENNNKGTGSFSPFKLSPQRYNTSKTYEQKKKIPAVMNSYDDDIWLLLDEMQKKFIGQEQAVENLFYNIVNNQQLADMVDLPDGQRAIIFLDGPTGTGKTAITREITDKLEIPFTSTSITTISSTGYAGGDITDTLKVLLKKANGDLEKAQRGIIVLDEFDKIAYSKSGGLEMKRAVQQQLLDFLGGGKYSIRVRNSIFDMDEIEFDTSKLTFVCLGALTELRSQKTKKKQSIGFETNEPQEELDYTITPQDLIEIGLERELVGRFNTYLHTNDYSIKALTKILKESTISPLIGFRLWIESRGKKLEIDSDVYNLIANQAYELNTGARSLQTVMNNIRTPFIKEVLRGTSDTIYLDVETVKKINGQTMSRKGRA